MSYRYALICLLLLVATIGVAQEQLSQQKAERLFAKGRELVEHNNYGAARQVFSEYLEAAPASDSRRSEAQYYMAYSALSLGHEDGERLINDFIEKNPSSPRASTAYYDIALFFYDQKSYTKATRYFRQVDFPALTADQQNKGRFAWGYSLFSEKKLKEALEQFNFVKTQKNAYAPAASYYAGYVEYANGAYDDALEDLKRAEQNSAYAGVVPYLIANVYYRQRDYDALLTYAESVQSRPNLANASEIAMLVAEAYYFKGDYQRAVDAYERYFSGGAGKSESPLLFRAGYASYTLGRQDKALDYLRKAAASSDTVSYYASYYLGIIYLKQGDKPLAMNAFNYARNNPADRELAEESAFQFGKVAYDAGRAEVAIPELEAFLQKYPSSAHRNDVREILAQAYVNGNDFNKAIEYIESLPARNAAMQQAYQKATYLKGSDLFNKEVYDQAVSFFAKSLSNPVDARYTTLANFWSGEAYSILGRYQDAVRHYTAVLGTGGGELATASRYGLGYAYYNLKDYDRAQIQFREYVNATDRRNPNHTDALIRLADCYYVSRSYPEALEYYTRARNIGSPDNDYILLQTGTITGFQRNYTEARRLLNDLVSSYPRSQYRDDALFQIAQFDIEQGNYQQAIDGLTRLLREMPGSSFAPYAYMRRAASHFSLKNYDATVSDYSRVIREYPTHPAAEESLVPLQEALTLAGKSGDFDMYLSTFKRANPDSKGLENVEYETAKNLYFNQKYTQAISALRSFMTSYPQSARNTEAKYYIAESHFRLHNYDEAIPLYEELARDHASEYGARIPSRLAEIHVAMGQYNRATGDFRRLEQLASSKKDLFTAWSGLTESYFQLKQYDSVSVYANLILEKGNVNASAQNMATLYLGKAAMEKGDYETAKDEFLNTLNTARDEYGAEAKYLLGKIFYLTKDYDQCYETLIGLNNDFSSYQEWVGKAFLLLADNFVAQEDDFQAKATLQSLIEHFPDPAVKEEARQKLKAIEERQAAEIPEEAPLDTGNDSLENR
ncbi:MAG TPA: tetratricopeptide repeat protein [Cyclobacteriaceae bacterium]